MERITFQRSAAGFNLAESNLAAACRALYSRASEPRLPQSLIEEASGELVRETYAIADRRSCSFLEAAARAVRARPALFKLTRCQATHDDDRSADAEIAAP
jgi:hypothetical protein